MIKMKDKNSQIAEFQQAANSLLRLFLNGERLTGSQENAIVDTINVLQVGYNEWLKRQPNKDQSFPTDSGSLK